MLAGPSGADDDVFGAMGAARPKPTTLPPDPEKLRISERELNPMLKPGAETVAVSTQPAAPPSYGAPGYKWRMMKLQRTYDMAEQRGVDVEEVAIERYGSMEAFNEARAERQHLEDRDGRPPVPDSASAPRRTSSAYRRPGASSLPSQSTRSFDTPTPSAPAPARAAIPSVLTAPQAPVAGPAPSASELNRLEARVLRAELSGQADAASLRAELEALRAKHEDSGPRVETLPVLDTQGRVYDVHAAGPSGPDSAADPSLNEMVRQERFHASSAGAHENDAALAQQIAGDRGFENDLEYMDDEAERFSRQRMKDDAKKRLFAIQGT